MHRSSAAPGSPDPLGHRVVVDDLLGQVSIQRLHGHQGGGDIDSWLVPRGPTMGLTRLEECPFVEQTQIQLGVEVLPHPSTLARPLPAVQGRSR